MAPNFVKSQSTAEASKMYREGHAMDYEPYTMAPEPYMKATQTWEFSLSCVSVNTTRRCNFSGLTEEDTLRLAFYMAR